MKKSFFIACVGLVLSEPVIAVVQCVPLNEYTVCDDLDDYTTTISKMSDIDLSCVTNGVRTNVKLISVGSSNTTASTVGTVAEDVDVDRTAVKLLHCWCKMVYPVVSAKWVYAGKGGAGGYTCNWECGTMLLNDSAGQFSRALFDSSNWLN